MIVFVGDIHGEFHILRSMITEMIKGNGYLETSIMEGNGKSNAIKIIQVGDFGWYPHLLKDWDWKCPFPIYAIEGNHEYFPLVQNWTHVTEVKPNLWYVPRGTVMNIDGYDIGFMGGAHSVDRYNRREGISWWPEEEVTEQDIKKLSNKKVDILVTHVPTHTTIQRNWGPLNKASWGLPKHWVDTSSMLIEQMWMEMGQPPIISGHMHKSVIDGKHRVLDVNQPVFLQPDMPKPVDWYEVAKDNYVGL